MKLAGSLQEELNQHLVGSLLAARALSTRLTRRQAPEAADAAFLVELLQSATADVRQLIVRLDTNRIQGRSAFSRVDLPEKQDESGA